MIKNIICNTEVHVSGGPGRFILGESTCVSAELADAQPNSVQLIYLDPPFGTGDTFRAKINNRKQTLTLSAYSDKLSTDDYMALMRETLQNCHRLLCNEGSIYLHIDHRMNARMRILMDEIFGEKNFLNEIVWCYKSGGRSKKHYSRKHDTILFYRKTANVYFNIDAVGSPRGRVKRNNMKRNVDETGRVYFSIGSGGRVYKYYEDEAVYPSDVWDDIEHLHQRDPERTGYATQKPEALLKRIIFASSREGDTVADFFSGSGTAAAVAAKTGRKFIASDASPLAMGILRNRLLTLSSNTQLFAPAHELTLQYTNADNASENNISIEYEISAVAKPTLTFKSYSGPTGLAYIAIGSINKNGCFMPQTHAINPIEGAVLQANSNAKPVLHVCDYDGSQSFIALQ